MDRATKEGLIRDGLQYYINYFKDSKSKFLENFKANPSHAIEWNSSSLVEAETKANSVKRIFKIEENGHDLIDALRSEAKTFRRDVERLYGMTSTSKFANAKDYHELKAESQFMETLESYIKYLEAIEREEQEAQDLKDNTTDTTKHVIQWQFDDLCQRWKTNNQIYENAKTKRDKQTYNEVVEQIESQMDALESLAESVGVTIDKKS